MTLLMVVLANDNMSSSSFESSLGFNPVVFWEGSMSAMVAALAAAGAIQLSGFVLVGVMIGELIRAQAAQGSVVCSQPQRLHG